MKKLFTGLSVILLLTVAAVAGASYWFGLQAERIYTAGLQQFANDHKLTLSSQQYQRNWFQSTSTAVLSNPKNSTTLKIDSLLQHGPLPWRSTLKRLRTDPLAVRPVQAIVYSHLQLQSQAAAAQSTPGYSLAGTAVTQVKINAETKSVFQFGKGRIESTAGSSINWQQASGVIYYQPQAQRLTGQFQSPKLAFFSPGKTAVMEALSGRFVLKLDDLRNPQNMRLSADRLEIQTAGATATAFSQFFIELPGFSEQLATMKVGFAAANWKKQQFGAGQFSLSSKALTPLFSSATTPPGLTELLQAFKTNPPSIQAQLQMTTENGLLDGQLDLRLKPEQLAGTNPLALFAALQADASLTIPRSLVEIMMTEKLRTEILLLQQQKKISNLSPQQLQQILEQAVPGRINALLSSKTFLLQADGRLTSHLQLQNSTLQLNGESLNIFELLGKLTSKASQGPL